MKMKQKNDSQREPRNDEERSAHRFGNDTAGCGNAESVGRVGGRTCAAGNQYGGALTLQPHQSVKKAIPSAPNSVNLVPLLY